jgi:hypothetical protein
VSGRGRSGRELTTALGEIVHSATARGTSHDQNARTACIIAAVAHDRHVRLEARKLGQALLDHHRARTKEYPPGKRVLVPRYTIRYADLCNRAGVSHVLRIVGTFLGEVAEWCAEEGFPPLNSLAIGQGGVPGEGYDGAGSFHAEDWPKDAEACVRFGGYPATMP